MPDVELTRTTGDRRLYALEGVGTLRVEGLASWQATVHATGSWRLSRRGLTGRRVERARDVRRLAVFVAGALADDAGGATAAATSGAVTSG